LPRLAMRMLNSYFFIDREEVKSMAGKKRKKAKKKKKKRGR
jgi:hypothetical protein